MQCIDVLEKVIYINTFSKSLTSTIRISYMVLPKSLMKKYQEQLGFYACTVSNFEQYTLAKFIERGYLEKHINRMRNFYRSQRDAILNCIRNHPDYARTQIREENAGLHFLLDVDTGLRDEEVIAKADAKGIHISCLSQYFSEKKYAREHTLIINYSGIDHETMPEAVERLFASLWNEKRLDK